MKIDRHNYEEFFILYWDNELDPSQRKAVEEFVQEHADLQEEFRLFGNTRFSPTEEVTFDSKELLVRTGSSIVDLSNYEQYLLSHVDDELNSTEKEELEKFLTEHPEIRTELALLSMARMQPDLHVEFPDKSSLYRKEERRTVISMTWFRIAAAAAILLIAGYLTFQTVGGGNTGTTQPGGNDPVAKAKTDDPKNIVPALKNNIESKNSATKETPDNSINNSAIATVPKNEVKKVKDEEPNQQLIAQNNTQDKIDQNKNQLPNTYVDPNATINGEETNLPRINGNVNGEDPKYAKNSLTDDNVTPKATNALHIQTPDQSTDVAKEGGGLKGLLRKATRVFEKRTNIQATTDDNKLLLGAFTVSLK